MSKAILVVDMPKCCNECSLMFKDEYSYWCPVQCDENKTDLYENYIKIKQKPNWCPLKPLPEKIDVPAYDDNIKAFSENAFEVGSYMYDRGHYRGYNMCIDKILNS